MKKIEKIVIAVLEIIALIIATEGFVHGFYAALLAPLFPVGFYYEDKLITFEEKIAERIKHGKR